MKTLIKITITICLFILTTCSATPFKQAEITDLTDSTDRFSLDLSKIQQGTVYHYKKANLDNTYVSRISIYVSKTDEIESFRIFPFSKVKMYTELIIAKFDYEKWSAKVIRHNRIDSRLNRKINKFIINIPEKYEQVVNYEGEEYRFKTGHNPVFNYNFDFADLNFFLRHLKDPKKPLKIGITTIGKTNKYVYSGVAEINFISEELCHQNECYKYSISGEGLNNETGYIWMNKEFGYFEKVEIPIENDSRYKSFKLELINTEKMLYHEWENYIEKETREEIFP